MNDLRQMPLFSSQPQTTDDLNRHTALRDSLALFQAHLMKAGKTQHTVKAFTADLHLLGEYAGETTRLGAFTTTRLNEFLHWLENGRGVPCSRKTYARRVTSLKVFFKWLHTVGAMGDDPAKAILQRSGPAPLAVILNDEQIAEALEFTQTLRHAEKPDPRPELLFRLLLETGIKKSETERLKQEDIVRTDPMFPMLMVRHKSAKDVHKERNITISRTLRDTLDEYLDQYRPREVIFNCTARNLEYVLEDVGKGAGIPNKLSFEMMRWTSAVRDYRAEIDPLAIRDKLGLSPISWQETYTKIKRLSELQDGIEGEIDLED